MGKQQHALASLLLPPLLLASAIGLFGSAGTLRASARTASLSGPARAASPMPSIPYENETAIFVDGNLLPSPGLCSADGLHYAPAEAFLAALDDSFWKDEKASLRYESMPHGGTGYLCVEQVCADWGVSTYLDGSGDRLWCTSAAGDWSVPEGYRVPVLMYHSVGDDLWPGEELVVRADDLAAQLEHLLARGYTPIWFEDLKHIDEIVKPVILTFDDGYRDNYTQLFPLLKHFGVKATIFVVSGYLDKAASLDRDMILDMLASGLVSVQCHTWYHPDLDTLAYDEQVQQLCWSKVALLELTDREPYVIAYPRGRQNEDTLDICRKEYRFGLKMGGAPYVTGDDPLLIHRIAIPRGMSLEDFASRFP